MTEIYVIVKLYSDWSDNEYAGIGFATTYEAALKAVTQYTNEHYKNYVEVYKLTITKSGFPVIEETKINKQDNKKSTDLESEDLKPGDYIEFD